MKSYTKHIKSVCQVGEKTIDNRKPIYRSSAIFPVLHNQKFSSQILFLGYWLLKRQLKEIGLLTTLRSASGEILARRNMTIDCVKAFAINLDELLDENVTDFKGSIELEVFSSRDMIFPYPAFVVTYFNDDFSTAVHTTGRVYNDVEDLTNNADRKVAESGFDIYADDSLSPFVSFVNGPIDVADLSMGYTLTNYKGVSKTGSFSLPSLGKYETVFLHFDEYIDGLADFLGGQPGSIKVNHDFTSFFPRFIAGNFQKNPDIISITHTYYDCSECAEPEDYWTRNQDGHHHSATIFPVFMQDDFYTDIALYPIFSPSSYYISFEFYNLEGQEVGRIDNYKLIESNLQEYQLLKLREILKDYSWKDEVSSARIITNFTDNILPSRLKLGLNIGIANQGAKLPCNICFAPQIGNPLIDKKLGTFKWSPIINKGNSVMTFHNSPTHKGKGYKDANVTLKFFRESDEEFLEQKITLPSFGQKTIDLSKEDEIRTFLNGESGWVTATSDSPYLVGWYFDFHESGGVAGDHSF
ncbi:MAG: hypothetical protein GY810_20705 [Aureispira sp.]|nr:hypothetical protein [Aureispira sp.]